MAGLILIELLAAILDADSSSRIDNSSSSDNRISSIPSDVEFGSLLKQEFKEENYPSVMSFGQLTGNEQIVLIKGLRQ